MLDVGRAGVVARVGAGEKRVAINRGLASGAGCGRLGGSQEIVL
jgi:hypothetical protein